MNPVNPTVKHILSMDSGGDRTLFSAYVIVRDVAALVCFVINYRQPDVSTQYMSSASQLWLNQRSHRHDESEY